MTEAPEPPELPATTYDAATLRESFVDPDVAALSAVTARLQATIRDAAGDETGELLARGDLVDLLRITGDLDDALHEGLAAVDRAEIAGTAAQQHLARLRLARVYQWQGDFANANPVYTELLSAATQFGPVVEAFTRQHAGENDYDQGHGDDAHAHFSRALQIRADLELDDAERSRAALAAAERLRGRS